MIYNIVLYNIENYILKYPYKNWDIEYLIKNNKITDFNALSKFKYIDDIISKYPDKPWDWEWIILNTDIYIEKYIPLNLIEKYSYKWCYRSLSHNSNLIEEFILKYPNKNWNIELLIENNKITDFKLLSKFRNINIYIIYKYPNKPWDWEWLIRNTEEGIEEYIPSYLIEKYLYKCKYNLLSKNPNLTEEYILKYPYKNWDIELLIENSKITDFKALTKFKNINQEIIDKYPNKLWDWEWLSENINYKLNYKILKKFFK